MKTAIILVSENALEIAQRVKCEIQESVIYSLKPVEGCLKIESYSEFLKQNFSTLDSIVFIGAMGICVRAISPFIEDKYTDPAVVCIDSTGKYVISVLSGHIGGANELTVSLARALHAEPVVTTQSDRNSLWALDTIWKEIGCRRPARDNMNNAIAAFVNGRPTALLTEISNEAILRLEQGKPAHVTVFHNFSEIDFSKFELLIAVTPYIHESPIQAIWYRPSVLHVGVGCRKDCNPEGVGEYIDRFLTGHQLSPESIASVSTIELKKDEPLIKNLAGRWSLDGATIYSADDLRDIEVPNPSEKAFQVTGLYGVAESSAIKSSGNSRLLIEKQKGILSEGNNFTFAVGLSSGARVGTTAEGAISTEGSSSVADSRAYAGPHIEIVGAGPGDPELVSVRGKRMLQHADLILYAGSLVPKELTYYAKPGATVRSSADLDLEEQFALMKEFYDKGKFIVRLHTGDPCIYGAIQEQMNFFDQYGMSYHITPGISSFQAAAAALKSQFTIPEKVQSIILTRGEGRTPMPEKEQLHKLAQSNSTMCIYLSAAIVEKVQEELLMAYPPETPVAACYKLTWKEEKIYRGELKDLAKIVRENNLTLTTLLVVGEAIDNRKGLSRLYAHEFKHLFRK